MGRTKPKKCTFEYNGHEICFRSINSAAEYFGIASNSLNYYLKANLPIFSPIFGCEVKFVKWGGYNGKQ